MRCRIVSLCVAAVIAVPLFLMILAVPQAAAQPGGTVTLIYSCANGGRMRVHYNEGDSARVTYRQSTHFLTRSEGGMFFGLIRSGARYVGSRQQLTVAEGRGTVWLTNRQGGQVSGRCRLS